MVGLKHTIIMLSGGVDSVAMMNKALYEGRAVLPVHIQMNQPDAEREYELALKAYNTFASMYQGVVLPLELHKLQLQEKGESPLEFAQIPILVLGAMYSMKRNTEEIQIGYIKSDTDTQKVLDDIRLLQRMYKPFMKWYAPITFPLINSEKQIIKL